MDPLLFALAGLIGGLALGWAFMASKLTHIRQMVASGEKQLEASALYAAGLKEQMETLREEKQLLTNSLEQARGELAAFRDHRLKEQKEELSQLQQKLHVEFKNTANTLFEEMNKKFSTQSEKQIGDLLNPMQQHLNEFKKLVVDSFTGQAVEQRTLKAEIEKIVMQADGLAKALRGDVKAQGNWGEMMLERILEASGLESGIGYTLQGAAMGLSGAEGNRLQPDVIIHLPENKHLIIDSKVSLTAYERYCSEMEDAKRDLHLKDFLRSVRAHVSGLAGKAYPDIDKLGTPDFVLMFLPIEGAFSLALQQDDKLHAYAWEKRIALVCPSTLFASLKTIASLWRIERYNRNAEEIALHGGRLYDKFAGFVEDMQTIGRQIGSVQTSYEKAMNKLSTGRGSLVSQTEKLRSLGAKNAKALPRELLDERIADADVLPLTAEG